MKRNFIIAATSIILFAGCVGLHSSLSKKENFKDFLSSFPAANIPFEIKGNEPYPLKKGEYLGAIFGEKRFVPELTESDFGRDVTSNCSYIASLFQNEQFSAVCYRVDNSLADTLPTNKYMLVTYNNKTGQKIDRLVFAGQASPSVFTSGLFNADHTISISTFKNIWKDDSNQIGYSENAVIRTELLETHIYRLDAKGRFLKIAVKDNSVVRN